jgi:hypothetical protein
MGSLPHKTADWQSTLDSNLSQYEAFMKELIVKPNVKDSELEAEKKKYQTMIDHPLSTSQGSIWNTYFKDQEIWDEIEKDVKRTRTEMYYFQQALDPTRGKTAEDKAILDR